MKTFLQNLLKITAYTGAAVLILLAVVVGLFRLFLPRLPEYQEEIKDWASEAIGMQVEFSGMNARWGFSGPELDFYDAELVRPGSEKRVIAAERVGLGISLGRLVFDRALVVDQLSIQETTLEIRQLEGGGWWIQGAPLAEIAKGRTPQLGEMEILGEDVEIQFLQPGDQRPRSFRVPRALISIDENRIAVDAAVRLPEDLGREIDVSASQLLGVAVDERSWEVILEAEDVLLAGWAELHPALEGRVLAGEGDIDLALVLADRSVQSATADIDFSDVVLGTGEPFDLASRLELDRSFQGWLAAAERFRLVAEDHEWPRSSLRAEAVTDANGKVVMLDVVASYVNLDDSKLLLPVLPDKQRDLLASLDLSGEIRDLGATLSSLGSDLPEYHVEASLDKVGFAADGKRPRVSGFTGYVSGNRAGGRLEIDSADMLVHFPQADDNAIDILTANGTLLWRRSDERTTILSDSIRISNPALDSRSSVQLTLHADGGAPEIDLNSSFSISDVAVARRYIPQKLVSPKLYDWFQAALVAGSMERGTASLKGPLDKFPFDNGEGRFLLETTTRNLTFKYHPDWPASEQVDMDIVLDNARLYTLRNRSFSLGNQSVDGNIEIADLREPVVTVKALVTGTLETLRQYSLQSPVNAITGGNLARVEVTGDASFRLDLTVPLTNKEGSVISGVLRSNNGTLAIEGLGAPVTDLIGEVNITGDQVTADSLGGRFLGDEVSFRITPGDDPEYFAIATATGTATGAGIIEELGVPIEGLIEGAAPYEARILFPRDGQNEATPLTVRIASSTRGLELKLPAPLAKPADEAMLVRGDIRFLADGEHIETAGVADNGIAWQLAFADVDGEWDFDRGVVKAGGGAIDPADTRGLHIRGRIDTVRLDDWLDLSRSGDENTGVAARIRSVDVVIDDFFAIGQHLKGHHVRVDRSARDWLVQIDGDDITGSIFVPYDFGSERAMTLEMERMRLPGDEVSPPDDEEIDPRNLPPIRLTANEFAIGDRYLGAVDVSFTRTPGGLETANFRATDATFEVVGTGRWEVDENDARGSRTSVTATLNSTDVATTLKRLEFAEGVSGDSMSVLFDLSFSGGPRANFLDELDGKVQLKLEKGQLEDVEPGAGRMLGLVSFVALPRRLSLDFRDVFNKGFRYDEISGSFDIVDGIASTCDMSLEGPAAIVGIVGQADMDKELYEQGAVVSAHVGNTLPLVGAVVGGPPGAAAMLIFSQIFKKPLQEVGQVYYSMAGTWDEPIVESISSEAFVRYGQLADCLSEGEQ